MVYYNTDASNWIVACDFATVGICDKLTHIFTISRFLFTIQWKLVWFICSYFSVAFRHLLRHYERSAVLTQWKKNRFAHNFSNIKIIENLFTLKISFKFILNLCQKKWIVFFFRHFYRIKIFLYRKLNLQWPLFYYYSNASTLRAFPHENTKIVWSNNGNFNS